jgi:hypothetical protein
MTPQQLLDAADTILTGQQFRDRRCWQRACATLIRLALERALDAYWQHRAPCLEKATMRSQLLALPSFAGDQVAARVRTTWYGLCRAVHHHCYELPPTAAELRSWHRDVLTLHARLNT